MRLLSSPWLPLPQPWLLLGYCPLDRDIGALTEYHKRHRNVQRERGETVIWNMIIWEQAHKQNTQAWGDCPDC